MNWPVATSSGLARLSGIEPPARHERSTWPSLCSSCLQWNVILLLFSLLSCVWLFCNPMDCGPQGSSVNGISHSRILEWVAISFSRGSSWPRVQTHISCIADGFFTTELPGNPWNVFLPCGNQHLWLLLRSYIQASVCVAPETQELPFFLNYWSWSKIFVQSVWQTVTIFE